jgi:sarcosine oxidase
MHAIVIGAGAFGAWSAWFLSERGHRVTLIDAYGPANPRASSADHSRVIRSGYGSDAIYSQWARDSLRDWQWLSRETGRELVTISGALFMAAPGNAYLGETYATLVELGIDVVRVECEQLGARYPQIATDGLGRAVFEPNAGVIRARAAVHALVALMRERNAVEYRVARLAPPQPTSTPRYQLTTGEALIADAVVCACGPWLPSLFPDAVGSRIRPTRQEVLHFGVPAGDGRFSLAQLPVWIDFEAGLYGIPDLDGRGFKIGIDRHGPAIDPDHAERLVDAEIVRNTRRWLARRFPAMAEAPLVDSHVCQYENTNNGDFIIDRHPRCEHLWIVGGGSGHGFKHGPAVGRHVAALVDGDTAVEPRFALANKQTTAARSVF